MKTESVGINSDLLDIVRIYAEVEKKSNVEMVNELVEGALDRYFIERSGGAVLTLPNPQFNYCMDEKKAEEFMDILNDTAAKLQELNSGISFPLEKVVAFFEYRLYLDSLDQMKQFRRNMFMDNDLKPKDKNDG